MLDRDAVRASGAGSYRPLGIIASGVGFGRLRPRGSGVFSRRAGAMSVLVFAGAAQLAAVGYVHGGFSWLGSSSSRSS
jgi:predicted branched-subunit amino acid permease